MCSHLFDIGAETVVELAGVSPPYTRRNNNDHDSSPRNSVNNKNLVLDAKPLCMAGTYGLDVEFKTKYDPDHKDD